MMMLGIGVLAISVVPAMADDPQAVFEVGDGNTTAGDSGSSNCDWNTLNNGKTTNSTSPSAPCPNGGPDAYSFLVGGASEKAFTTGGSKDSNLISAWKWSNTSTPDKDTITHGYGASFTSTGGHNILAFGAERFDVNGDANIGVWFFQQTVAPITGGGFSGAHVDGDIFAVSAFTAGGSHPELDIYKWDHTCSASHYSTPTLPLPAAGACADTNIKWIFAGLGGTICAAGSSACSSVNSAPLNPSWSYVGKGGTTVPVAGFYEGGLDLTNLLPSSSGTCFTSFLMETRSSASVSAVLKDFVSGSFPQCHITVSKACACTTLHTDGTGYDYAAGGTVTNDGTGPLLNVKVTDDQIANVTWNCGSMSKGDVKTWGNVTITGKTACTASGGTSAGQGGAFTSASTSVSNTAHVVADTTSGLNPTQITSDSQVTCDYPGASNVCQSNAALTVTNSCVTALEVNTSKVVVRVDYTGTVKNTGNVNITGVTVTGTNTGSPSGPTFTIGTLTPGKEVCYTNGAAVPPDGLGCPSIALSDFGAGPASTPTGAANYYPNSLSAATTATGISPGRARFTGRVQASGTNAATSISVSSDPKDASCLVCDQGFCPTP